MQMFIFAENYIMEGVKHIGALFVDDNGKKEIIRVYYKGERVELNDIRVEWIDDDMVNDDWKLEEGTVLDYGQHCLFKGIDEGSAGDDW